MTGDAGAAARVRLFIEDWCGAWKQVRPLVTSMYDLNGLAAAGTAMTPLLNGVAQRHAGRRLAIGQGGFPLPDATHDPAQELVTGAVVTGDHAQVATTVTRERGSFRHVYALARVDGEWRINGIETTLEHPDLAPPPDPPPAALEPPTPGLELDVDGLFRHGRDVALGDERSTLDVLPAVPWTTAGRVAVWDLGWGIMGMAPLALPAPAGTYPVEVARAFGRNVALRVRFTDAPVATWHSAGSVGVDSGTVALLDLDAVESLDEDAVERLFTDATQALGYQGLPRVHPLDLGSGVVAGLLVESGWGDGGYPVSWGADAAGGVAALLVDFLVLAEPIRAEVRAPFAAGSVEDPALDRAGMTYRIEGDDTGWRFVGTRTDGLRLRVMSPGGGELLNGDRLALSQRGETWTQEWRPDSPVPAGSMLVLELSTGYRHL